MDKKIIALSGSPSSGKDTITNELCSANSKYKHFIKHRTSDEISNEYINITEEEFRKKVTKKEFLQHHQRYGKHYGVDRQMLFDMLNDGFIPIIHIGRIENFYSLKSAIEEENDTNGLNCEIIHILLWEETEVLEKRIKDKHLNSKTEQEKIKAIRVDFNDNKKLLEKNQNPYSYIIKNINVEYTCNYIDNIISNGEDDWDNGYDLYMKYVLATTNLNQEGEKNFSNSICITCKKKIDEDGFIIKNRAFSRNVSLENIRGNEKIRFENCIFENIKLSEINCNNVEFISCTVNDSINIYKGKIENLIIRDCTHIEKILIENITKKDLSLEITKSCIEELKVLNANINNVSFKDVESACKQIKFLSGATVGQLNIGCFVEKLCIKELPYIYLSKEGKIESIELETINKKALRNYEKRIIDVDKNGNREDELHRHKSVVLAALQSFESRKLFVESDICLFEVRRLGIQIKRESKNIFKKIVSILQKILFEYIFGWGIRVTNNIVTMLFVIFGFSVIYYFAQNAEKLPAKLSFYKCFEVSINRFFIVGAGEYNFTIISPLDSIESIIGVILLTVITGVMVRKIIR